MWLLTIHYCGKRWRKFFETYVDAKRFDVVEWMQAKTKSEPLGDDTSMEYAIAEYIDDYQRRYPRSNTQQLEQRLSYLLEFPKVRDVTSKKLSHLIENKRCRSGKNKGKLWSRSTRQSAKVVWGIFLKWCSRKEYTSEQNWKIEIQKVKYNVKEIGILGIEEARALLNEINRDHQPALAMMFFLGVRPNGEMSRLQYKHIQWGKSVKIPGDVAKWSSRTIHDLPENLWSWIPKKRSGLVMSSWSGLNQSRRRACRRLGFEYPSDGARHSFGTYGYWHRGVEWTMHTMGHSNYDTFPALLSKQGSLSSRSGEIFFDRTLGFWNV